jgi:DNA (cytosine-5)-methyltransferase 1
MKQAGVEVLAQLEELDAAFDTAELNLGDSDHILAPYDRWPVDKYVGRTNVLYANPPCAPWSSAGGLKGMADPRIVYSEHSLNTGLALGADFIVIESVCRAWSTTGGRPLYEDFVHKAQQRGYAVTLFFTSALLHGAPQVRQRFHFIAHKYEIRDLLTVPQPVGYKDIVTVRDVIGDLEYAPDNEEWGHVRAIPSECDLNVMHNLRQGDGWYEAWERAVAQGLFAKKSRFITHRPFYDAPMGTILDIDSVIHPTQDRPLTMREGARLCGYPDDFQFARDKRGKFHKSDATQAVLPFVAKYLGGVFYKGLERGLKTSDAHGYTLIDLRPLAKPFTPTKYMRWHLDLKEV